MPRIVRITENLAKRIFRELGDVRGLDNFPALTELEKKIVDQLNLNKQ
jgi:hypothetical protein